VYITTNQAANKKKPLRQLSLPQTRIKVNTGPRHLTTIA